MPRLAGASGKLIQRVEIPRVWAEGLEGQWQAGVCLEYILVIWLVPSFFRFFFRLLVVLQCYVRPDGEKGYASKEVNEGRQRRSFIVKQSWLGKVCGLRVVMVIVMELNNWREFGKKSVPGWNCCRWTRIHLLSRGGEMGGLLWFEFGLVSFIQNMSHTFVQIRPPSGPHKSSIYSSLKLNQIPINAGFRN